MMKAGPCHDIFLPFEACLDKCLENGEDSSEVCKQSFGDLMVCVRQNSEVYEEIQKKMKAEEHDVVQKEVAAKKDADGNKEGV
mmetsp:Transcript_5942/g.7714  ORF Transcript_5942/g.7714 Transcript_5942/m.7714 type:complete len:83 (-) Transcript_5942:167-415(-)